MPTHLLPIMFMLSSTLSLSVTGLLSKLLVGELGSTWLSFLRFLIPALILLVLFGVKARVTLNRHQWRIVSIRSLCIAACQLCFLWSLQSLSLVEGIVLFSTGPLFIPVLEKLIFNQAIRYSTLVGLLGAFVGVYMLSSASGQINWRPELLVGLVAGMFNAGSQVSLYRITRTGLSPYAINMWTFLTSAVMLLPLVLLFPIDLQVQDIQLGWVVALVVIALLIINTQVCRSKAYQMVESSSQLSPLIFTNLLFTSIWQALFFEQNFSSNQIVGLVLIVASTSIKPLKDLVRWILSSIDVKPHLPK